MNSNSIITKGAFDIVTMLAMIGCRASADTVKGHRRVFRTVQEIANDFSWGTLHSIFSIVFNLKNKIYK